MVALRRVVEVMGQRTHLRNSEETDPLGNVVNTGEEPG